MGAPGYAECASDERLSGYVAGYWSSHAGPGAETSHAVLPDGCIDVLFDAARGQLSVVGTMTRALWVRGCGPTSFVGIRFRPGGAVPFLRERADQLTDDIADAEALLGAPACALTNRLGEAPSVREQVRALEAFFLERLDRGIRPVDPRLAWATQALAARRRSVTEIAAELGMSRQYLRRLFVEHTGVSPKMFERIARLSVVAQAMTTGMALAEAAAAAGYADQAHMTNEFQRLVGTTPSAYRRGFPFLQDGPRQRA